MSEDQNRKNRGEQITSALSDALSTGDFSVLNDLVSQTLADTLNDAGRQIAKTINEQQEQQRHSNRYTQEQLNKIKEQQREREEHMRRQRQAALQRQRQRETYQQAQRKAAMDMQQPLRQQQPVQGEVVRTQKKNKGQPSALVPVKFTEVGNVSGILQQVFGGIGLGFTGLMSMLKLLGIFLGSVTLTGWLISLIFPVIFFGMIRFGAVKRDRLQRAKRYIQLCGNKMYGQIETLARDTGKSIRYVTKDISKMLSLGMFPEGHLDDQKTCFMLNDSIHRQYLETRDNHVLLEKEQAAQKQAVSKEAPSSLKSAEESELNTMIAEGMNCIHRLQELNDQIPGEVISEKLYRLESLLKDIFNGVRVHPEQMRRMHSMMDYYLPTTMKLVEAYRDFDKLSSPGSEVSAAKEEIERTLDIINQAFAELLDNLFQDAVFDATTDAQVLKTMLAKGGLTGNTDFTNNTVSGGNENE